MGLQRIIHHKTQFDMKNIIFYILTLLAPSPLFCQGNYFGAWQSGSGEEQVRVTQSLDTWIDYANDFVNNEGLYLKDFEYYEVDGQSRYFGAWQSGSGEEQVRITTSLSTWIDYANDFVNNEGLYLKDFEYYEIDGQSYYFGAWQSGSGEEQVRITQSLDTWIDYANDFVNNEGLYLKDFEYYEIDGQSYYFGAWQSGSGEEQVRITQSLDTWADYANDFVNEEGLYLKDFEYYEIDGQSYYFGAWQSGSGEEQVRITETLNAWGDYANDFVNNEGLYLKDFEYYDILMTNVSSPELESDLSIFPNPTNDYLRIDSKNLESANVRIFNLVGQLILEVKETNLPQTIDVQNFEKGIYVLEIEVANAVVSKRIIVN